MTCPSDKLYDHFSNLFNESYENLNSVQTDIVNEVMMYETNMFNNNNDFDSYLIVLITLDLFQYRIV